MAKLCAICKKGFGLLSMKVKIADNQFMCADCNLLAMGGDFYIATNGKSYRDLVARFGTRETWTIDVCKIAIEETRQYERELVELVTKEHRNKCNVCGHVYCYNQSDIAANNALKTNAKLNNTISVFTAFSDLTTAAVSSGNADNAQSRIVDFNKCPKCNSSNIRAFTDEEWEKEKTSISTQTTNNTIVSSADELKKYKELLDSGVISQDEFDAKKKQLLGL